MKVHAVQSGSVAVVTTALAPIMWGSTYIVITEALPPGRPLFVAAMRVVPAGLVLVAFGRLRARARPRGREWAHGAVLAVFNFGLFFPFLIVGAQHLPGGVAAAIGGVQPLLVTSISWLVYRRRPGRAEVVLGMIAVIGVSMIVLRRGAAIDAIGVVAALVANVSFATGVVLTKRLPRPANPVAATGWQLLIGGVVLIPLTLTIDGLPTHLDPAAAAGFAYLSLVATGAAFVAWFDGVRRLAPPVPPLLGLAGPLTGAILGWILLGQSLTTIQLAGFVITLGAIARGALVDRNPVNGNPAPNDRSPGPVRTVRVARR